MTIRLVLLLAVVALVITDVASGGAGEARGARRIVVVPAVRTGGPGDFSSDALPLAYVVLHRAGLRVSYGRPVAASSVSNCWPIVASQRPRAGTRVVAGTVVTLAIGMTPCPLPSPAVPRPLPSATVPNFRGHTVTAVAAWAGRHHLYWRGQVPALTGGTARQLLTNFRVAGQRPRPGTVLKAGSVGAGGRFTPTPLVVRAFQP
jgi:hypothetical protein